MVKQKSLSPEVLHTAARLEDKYHGWAKDRALKSGWKRTVIAYDSYGSESSLRVLARVVLTKTGMPAADTRKSIRGWRSFGNVPLGNDSAWVRVNGVDHQVRSDRGGIIDAVIPGEFSPGPVQLEMWTDDSLVDTATVRIIGEDQDFGIISDIDDTVMVTALPRPFLAAWNSFVLDEHARSPVAGMAVLYDRLTYLRPNSPIVYLSTGAWNVQPTLRRFLSRNLYPEGPLLLTDWGPTATRAFRSGQEHKQTQLERLAREFPGMKWLLVGDDGQHDEEIYAHFVENHPENVLAVAIRQLTAGEAVWAGGRSRRTGRGRGVPWVYASDGAGLASKLTERGILH
ncbi:App1 family protein [Brevibacterium litoralis]|uniref:App1 family protein n=1 Tax=Brevibacterium litoralis TaxID=3138935 RepID=UPI0032ECBD77